MTAAIHTEGLAGLLAWLEELDEQRLLDAAAQGMQDELEMVAAEAAALCPKDTGALAQSIAVRVSSGAGQLSGEVYADEAYAVHVEMGTQAQPARPFLYPALKANQANVVQRIAQAVGGMIRNGEEPD